MHKRERERKFEGGEREKVKRLGKKGGERGRKREREREGGEVGTDAGLEAADLVVGQRVALCDDGDQVDPLVEAAHEGDVERLEPVGEEKGGREGGRGWGG